MTESILESGFLPLQWSRSLRTAETGMLATVHISDKVASMEPQS